MNSWFLKIQINIMAVTWRGFLTASKWRFGRKYRLPFHQPWKYNNNFFLCVITLLQIYTCAHGLRHGNSRSHTSELIGETNMFWPYISAQRQQDRLVSRMYVEITERTKMVTHLSASSPFWSLSHLCPLSIIVIGLCYFALCWWRRY